MYLDRILHLTSQMHQRADCAKRLEVITEARTWVGTPFHHQGYTKALSNVKGGADCIGMIRGIAHNLDLCEVDVFSRRAETYMGYGKIPHPLKFLGALHEYMREIPVMELLWADVLVFRGKRYPQHIALITDRGIVHSYEPNKKIVEHDINDKWWARRMFAFRFPVFIEG